MWGGPPFWIADNSAVDVRDLAAASGWYMDKLGCREAALDREDDSGRPFVDLCISREDTILSLIELPHGRRPEQQHVIFYARNLEKAHKWLAERGVAVEQPTSDSGGESFLSV